MTDATIRMTVEQARELALEACLGAGASMAMARSLLEATLSAMQFGRPELGFPHLLDYLAALDSGRIKGDARPRITYPLPSLIESDAAGGIAQLGFDQAFADLCGRAQTLGIAMFTQRNSFTTGELGYYVRRLALAGLVSFAVTNGPALMAVAAGRSPVYCTNPLAFGSPMPASNDRPLVIDQASSVTAFVNVMRAAAEHAAIPEDWAIDASGRPTTDAQAAVTGALLPFGGYKGANIALLVEIMSAGLSQASWSLDAASFTSGHETPDAGLTVIAIAPIDGDFRERLGKHIRRLQAHGVSIPSQRRAAHPGAMPDSIELAESIVRRVEAYRKEKGKRVP